MEALEGRDVPSTLVFNDTFNWSFLGKSAAVEVTVTADKDGFEGLYHWEYAVTNTSPAGTTFGNFTISFEDTASVANLDHPTGWTPTVSSGVSWDVGGSGSPILSGGSADFSFTTLPTAVVLQAGGAGPIPGMAAGPAPALVVDTNQDVVNLNDGVTSLREAIDYVNGPQNLAGIQRITFIPNLGTITLGTLGQLPEITKNIFIDGIGKNVTVTRDATKGDFGLLEVGVGATSTIAGLILTGGGGDTVQAGGAVASRGNLTLQSCEIHHNNAKNAGAVYALEGTLDIVGCDIHHNNATGPGATGAGGGIYIGGKVTFANIINSTIRNNTATEIGGGIYIKGGEDFLVVNNTVVNLSGTTVSFNGAEQGGGIFVGRTATPQLRLLNNTLIAYNYLWGTDSKGGGVFLGAGSVTLDGVTFAYNDGTFGDGCYAVNGTSWTEGPGGVDWIEDGIWIGP